MNLVRYKRADKVFLNQKIQLLWTQLEKSKR